MPLDIKNRCGDTTDIYCVFLIVEGPAAFMDFPQMLFEDFWIGNRFRCFLLPGGIGKHIIERNFRLAGKQCFA